MSATNVARAGKRGNICVGNNVSSRLPGPLQNKRDAIVVDFNFELNCI